MNAEQWLVGNAPLGEAVVVTLFVAVVIEAGLLVPVLPADSLMLGVGYLTRQGGVALPLWALCMLTPLIASLGQHGGYLLGRLGVAAVDGHSGRGHRGSERIARAAGFLRRHGAWIVLVGPFLPFIRTYVPVAAGAVGMQYRVFVVPSLLGCTAWTVGLLCAGTMLGDGSLVRSFVDGLPAA